MSSLWLQGIWFKTAWPPPQPTPSTRCRNKDIPHKIRSIEYCKLLSGARKPRTIDIPPLARASPWKPWGAHRKSQISREFGAIRSKNICKVFTSNPPLLCTTTSGKKLNIHHRRNPLLIRFGVWGLYHVHPSFQTYVVLYTILPCFAREMAYIILWSTRSLHK